MADSERTFPDPGATPGKYPIEWLVGRRRFTGDVELAARRRPYVELNGKLKRPRRTASGELVYEFPGEEISFPRLVGQLRSNEEVVVIDATVSQWFMERYFGFGQWAIVGLDIASVPGDRYEQVTFQISDADLWFGAAPLEKSNWPSPDSVERTYSATLNPAAYRVWRDTRNGITIDFGYPHTFSLDPYNFGLTFAPVFDIRSREPLSLDEWRRDWLAPLIDLASIATKHPQTLSWLKVAHGSGRSRRSGTVFTGGIHQSPYAAHYDLEWRRSPEKRPLFTLAESSVTPMKLVRKWRSLSEGNDPFVELYRAALFQTDLPPRARFLHLIQALEARHSFANQQADESAQLRFATKRAAVIEATREAGVSTQDLRFLKDEWSKQKRDSLDRRLGSLLDDLPTGLRAGLVSDPALDPIRLQLIAQDNAKSLQAQLRVLRNKLSHGERNYPDFHLQPWVAAVETICQAQLLALLGGFSPAEIESALMVP